MDIAPALPVLMYHHVSPKPGLVTVSPENFRAQMAWLAAHGYRSASADDLAAFLAGQSLPAKSVVITFDDGYLDNYLHAHPVLREFGFTAVLFLITGQLGDGPTRIGGDTHSHRTCMERIAMGRADDVMVRWSEVEAMTTAGSFEFHSHTHTHTRWDQQIADSALRRLRLAEDLSQSQDTLRQRLGAVSGHLCWPQGYYDADYIAVAREAGFDHLYTVERHTCLPETDPVRIPRLVIKDKGAGWFGLRMAIYRHPLLAQAYEGLRRGKDKTP